MQEVVTLLAGNAGLERIEDLIELVTHNPATLLKDIFSRSLLPLIKILCYPNVSQSNILEKSVVDIYNWVYGPNGSRAAFFLPKLITHLIDKDDAVDTDDLNVVLSFFAQLMLHNDSTNSNDTHLQQAEILVDTALEITTKIKGSQDHSIRRTADQLDRFFKLGKAISPAHSKSATEPRTKAKFVLDQKPPGGRHDNDHADIRKIKIMPTYEEILSNEAEFLPSRDDCEVADMSRLQALFDRHFRLLREDTIGQLRDAAGEAIYD